jgi:hypothetical protein
MLHKVLNDARFFYFLLLIDQDIAEIYQARRCPFCGGILDVGHFSRKPRGQPDGVKDDFKKRFSFCCRKDGCRKRVTPPSVRYLDRKIYLKILTVLVVTMKDGASNKNIKQLKSTLKIDWHTLKRWRDWWTSVFPKTNHGIVVRGRLPPSNAQGSLICQAMRSFLSTLDDLIKVMVAWGKMLLFLTPLATVFDEKNIVDLADQVFPQKIPTAKF